MIGVLFLNSMRTCVIIKYDFGKYGVLPTMWVAS